MSTEELLQQLIDAQQAYRTALDTVQAQAPDLFKSIRQQYSLTQRDFAAALSVDFSFISKVENGHLRPGKPVLQRLATYLTEQLNVATNVAATPPTAVESGKQP
jgi:transcriptional regulator with XRE-family HTH domain